MSKMTSSREVEVRPDSSIQMLIEPAGVYETDQQLSFEQIVELKKRFRENEDLVPEVCAFIVVNMLLETEDEIKQEKAEVEARGGSVYSTIDYETREDFAHHVGLLSASWAIGLKRALELPSGEWPEGITPPATFAIALEKMKSHAGEDQNG